MPYMLSNLLKGMRKKTSSGAMSKQYRAFKKRKRRDLKFK